MKKILAFTIILIVLFFLAKGWWNNQLAPVSNDQSTKIVVVEKGESFSELTTALKKQNLIKSVWAFNLYAKQTGVSTKIQPGAFRLSPSQTSEQILKSLSSSPLDNRVTLLEGWRVEEMASELSSKFNPSTGSTTLTTGSLVQKDSTRFQSSKFVSIATEGYMFPDTYLFPTNVTEEWIVKKLRDTFDARFSDDLRVKIKTLGLTEGQGVILASIVEREARSDEARRMVASILLKRFQIGMALNADATVQYALGFQKSENSWWKRNLSRDDLKINSLYNTYLHAGLPPAPICNPGLSSLTAVANADPKTPYLYYYHDSKGISHYAKTLEEHNQNVADYP